MRPVGEVEGVGVAAADSGGADVPPTGGGGGGDGGMPALPIQVSSELV